MKFVYSSTVLTLTCNFKIDVDMPLWHIVRSLAKHDVNYTFKIEKIFILWPVSGRLELRG